MNQPNSPRPGNEPSSKSLAQELFGVHFAPGGPVADPDDLDGLDFGSLAPAAPSIATGSAAVVEIEEEEVSITSSEEWAAIEKAAPLSDDEERIERPVASSLHRKPVPRLQVPRDDDDDGFGAGLLSAFDDDDDDDLEERAAADSDVPDDDDDVIESPRVPSPGRGRFEASATAAELDDEDEVEDDAPVAALKSKTEPNKDDDFWDALEGWDWETSGEGGDREERSSGGSAGGRGDRSGRGRTGRSRPVADEGASRERPRREETRAPKAEGERKERSRGRGDSGRGERTERPAREASPPRAASSDKPKSIFASDEGGFADDLFGRLEGPENSRKTGSRRDEARHRDDDRDAPLPAKKSLDDLAADDSGEEDAAGSGRRRPRRRRGRGRGPAEDRPVDSVEPVEPQADFDEPAFDDEGDGFGAGLAPPRRTSERPSSGRTQRSEPAGRGTSPRGERSRDEAPRGEREGSGRGEQRAPRERNAAPERETRPKREARPSSRAERGDADERVREDLRDDRGRSERPAKSPRGRDADRNYADRPARAERSERPDCNERGPVREAPPRRRDEEDVSSRDRDDRGSGSRSGSGREERSGSRTRGERTEGRSDSHSPRSGRGTEGSRKPESSRAPERSKRSAEPADDEDDDRPRGKIQAIEVPTWEHAISLLIARHPKPQDRGSSRSGPRGDDRGSSRGRGRRGQGDR